jgi:hypothetical protein
MEELKYGLVNEQKSRTLLNCLTIINIVNPIKLWKGQIKIQLTIEFWPRIKAIDLYA